MKHTHANKSHVTKAHDFIAQHPLAVLSTVSAENSPWGAAIYAVADEDFNFYFITREQTQKYQNISANAHVSLTFADPQSQTTVQASGVAEKVQASEIIDVVFKKLAAVRPKDNINWMPPVVKVHQGDWMILKVTPTYAQYADYQIRVTHPDDNYIFSLV